MSTRPESLLFVSSITFPCSVYVEYSVSYKPSFPDHSEKIFAKDTDR